MGIAGELFIKCKYICKKKGKKNSSVKVFHKIILNKNDHNAIKMQRLGLSTKYMQINATTEGFLYQF